MRNARFSYEARKRALQVAYNAFMLDNAENEHAISGAHYDLPWLLGAFAGCVRPLKES